MASDSKNSQVSLCRLREALRRAGVKLTLQRLEIFREVLQTSDHPDAETVYHRVRERVPTVSLDTVYRNLWLLHDLGLILALGSPRERVRFDGDLRPHHHFICTRCGAVHDFCSAELDRLQLPADVSVLGSVDKVQVEIRGLCNHCAGTASPPDPPGLS